MVNGMAGIDETAEVLARSRGDMPSEEGEQAGVQVAKEEIVMTEDFADGYYFTFPFNRVTMLENILSKCFLFKEQLTNLGSILS